MFTDPSAQHGGPSPPPLDSLRADSHRGWQGAQSSQAQWPQNDPGRKVGEVITAPAKVLWPWPWFHSRPFSLLPPQVFETGRVTLRWWPWGDRVWSTARVQRARAARPLSLRGMNLRFSTIRVCRSVVLNEYQNT